MREESKDNRARSGIKQNDLKSHLVSRCPVYIIPVTLLLVPVLGRWGREVTANWSPVVYIAGQPAGGAQ